VTPLTKIASGEDALAMTSFTRKMSVLLLEVQRITLVKDLFSSYNYIQTIPKPKEDLA
jgi:hypothetical protein